MNRLFYFILCLFFFNVDVIAQKNVITKVNADCHHALEIKDSVWGPVNAPDGPGEIMEIYGPAGESYLFEKEHNTVWYYFNVPYTGILTFDIIPENIRDDYDFILYRINDTGFCNRPMNFKPVRSCISRNDSTIGSKTGLAAFGVGNYFPSGTGPSYCQELEVKEGELYYLVLDNVYEEGKGHQIHLHYRSPDIQIKAKKPSLNINIRDENTDEPVNADIEIFEMIKNAPSVLLRKFTGTMSCFVDLEFTKNYAVRIYKAGYLCYSHTFSIPDTQNIIKVNAGLRPLHQGDTLIFDNIYFYGNQALILPESYSVLENIYNTIEINRSLTIEIRGHVNAPLSHYEPGSYLQLSVDRAKAIYDFLIQKGIAPERMRYKGFANNMMIFPYAWKEEEMKLNRRVEVVIISM